MSNQDNLKKALCENYCVLLLKQGVDMFFEALAIILNIIYLILVYYAIFRISKALYRKGAIWLVSFLIFLSPFVFSVVIAGSLTELLWVFLLTPFLGVAILMMLFTNWILLYYGVSYSILAVLYYMFRHKHSADESKNTHLST